MNNGGTQNGSVYRKGLFSGFDFYNISISLIVYLHEALKLNSQIIMACKACMVVLQKVVARSGNSFV